MGHLALVFAFLFFTLGFAQNSFAKPVAKKAVMADIAKISVKKRIALLKAIQEFMVKMEKLVPPGDNRKTAYFKLFEEAQAVVEGDLCWFAGWKSVVGKGASGRLTCKSPKDTPEYKLAHPNGPSDCDPRTIHCAQVFALVTECVPFSSASASCKRSSNNDLGKTEEFLRNQDPNMQAIKYQMEAVRKCSVETTGDDSLSKDVKATCETLMGQYQDILNKADRIDADTDIALADSEFRDLWCSYKEPNGNLVEIYANNNKELFAIDNKGRKPTWKSKISNGGAAEFGKADVTIDTCMGQVKLNRTRAKVCESGELLELEVDAASPNTAWKDYCAFSKTGSSADFMTRSNQVTPLEAKFNEATANYDNAKAELDEVKRRGFDDPSRPTRIPLAPAFRDSDERDRAIKRASDNADIYLNRLSLAKEDLKKKQDEVTGLGKSAFRFVFFKNPVGDPNDQTKLIRGFGEPKIYRQNTVTQVCDVTSSFKLAYNYSKDGAGPADHCKLGLSIPDPAASVPTAPAVPAAPAAPGAAPAGP